MKHLGVNSAQSYIYGKIEPISKEDFAMSDKTRKTIKAVSMSVTVLGVCGLVVSGATENDISLAVKVGTGIAAVIATFITALLPKK